MVYIHVPDPQPHPNFFSNINMEVLVPEVESYHYHIIFRRLSSMHKICNNSLDKINDE